MNSPDFLLIGPPKCGTTSIWEILRNHSQIYMPNKKEIDFFTLNYSKGVDYYQSYFKDNSPEKIRGEASTWYFFTPFATERIKIHYPEIKLICVLRNPTERFISHWRYYSNQGFPMEFDEFFQQCLKFHRNKVTLEGNQGEREYLARRHGKAQGWQWYLYIGEYTEHLDRFWRVFGKKSLLITRFEDLRFQPEKIYGEICKFLNVESIKLVDREAPVSRKTVSSERHIYTKILGEQVYLRLRSALPDSVKNILTYPLRKFTPHKPLPKPTVSQIKQVIDYYHPYNDKLELMLDTDLSSWNSLDPYKDYLDDE